MNVAQVYHTATSLSEKKEPADPAIEQAAVEKRIWLNSSKTQELSKALQDKISEHLSSAMTLACQASPTTDDQIRSLLQQAAALNRVNNILKGKTDKYE